MFLEQGSNDEPVVVRNENQDLKAKFFSFEILHMFFLSEFLMEVQSLQHFDLFLVHQSPYHSLGIDVDLTDGRASLFNRHGRQGLGMLVQAAGWPSESRHDLPQVHMGGLVFEWNRQNPNYAAFWL